MFSLDQEIDKYCRSVYAQWYEDDEQIDELKDHLYCEIDHLQEEGMLEDQAFFEATKQMGDVKDIRKELSKNRTVFSAMYDLTRENYLDWRLPMSSRKTAVLHIIVALIFAITITITDYFVEQSQYAHHSQAITNWLLVVYMVPFFYLCAAADEGQRTFGERFAEVKQKVSGIFTRR